MLGAALWAADDVRVGSLIAKLLYFPAEVSHCVPSSKVRGLILQRGISDGLAAFVILQISLCDAFSQLLLSTSQECNNTFGDAPRSGVLGVVTSLLSAFGAVPSTPLQPLRHNGGFSKNLLSQWQPSCYIAPDATYQEGVTAPASTFKGDTFAIRRAATVAAGGCPSQPTWLPGHLAPCQSSQ